MYRQSTNARATDEAKCPECGCKRLLYGQGKLKCTDCGHLIHANKRRNKYNATKTTFQDIKYDSMFEAEVAAELDILKKSGAIKDWERQYKVEMWAYRPDGVKAFCVKHKVDFRAHSNDGSFELIEVKGMELDDWKWRKKFLENIWLPMHLDHTYTVRKQTNKPWRR